MTKKTQIKTSDCNENKCNFKIIMDCKNPFQTQKAYGNSNGFGYDQ